MAIKRRTPRMDLDAAEALAMSQADDVTPIHTQDTQKPRLETGKQVRQSKEERLKERAEGRMFNAFGLYLTPAQSDLLKYASAQTHRSQQDIVRTTVMDYLEEEFGDAFDRDHTNNR